MGVEPSEALRRAAAALRALGFPRRRSAHSAAAAAGSAEPGSTASARPAAGSGRPTASRVGSAAGLPSSRFRPSAEPLAARAPSHRQAAALLSVLVLVVAATVAASYLVAPAHARSFTLFYGSAFLDDERAPVAVDLTDAKPTVRLINAASQVSAADTDLQVLALRSGSLLLNRRTGEFNMIDPAGLVVKTQGGGVRLRQPAGLTSTTAVAADLGDATPAGYIVQAGTSSTAVYLVGLDTVQNARVPGNPVKPRASLTLPEPSAASPGSLVSAGSALWLLTGTGPRRSIVQLSVPEGSPVGARLAQSSHGTVSGPAALESANVAADGSGGTVVGVADRTGIRVIDGDGAVHQARLDGLAAADTILAASNAQGRLSYLYHLPGGWRLVSVGSDGHGARNLAVAQLPVGGRLGAPAMSDGALYTMDIGGQGTIWRVDADGSAAQPTGGATYPVVRTASGQLAETPDFSDSYLLARGARVIFDSPYHREALAIFTDGSHPPVVINKSAATALDATGTASALAQNQQPTSKPSRGATPPPARPAPDQPVNPGTDCKTAHQVPHIPQITTVSPGSRSVTLGWTYPLLDPQDCAPSTYRVSVRLLSSGAPHPPGAVTVQGETGVTITGLYPSSRYAITVTAYLNGVGTSSTPQQVTTGPAGPNTPTGLSAAITPSGGWALNWNGCGSASGACVPAASWTVIPSFCDGQGLSSPPPQASVPGDPTRRGFSYAYPGTGLLGRGVKFAVQGIGVQGTIGTPTSSGCVYSWTAPVTARISLTASTPPSLDGTGTTSTVATAHVSGDPATAFGGTGAQLTYILETRAGQQIASTGVASSLSARLYGIKPGQAYQVLLRISPPRHPEASATVGPVPVVAAAADWPPWAIHPSFAASGANGGTLTVRFSGLSSAPSGETFSFSGALNCGNTSLPLTKSGIDPRTAVITVSVDRTQLNGACQASGHFTENATGHPPYYGGGPSPDERAAITIAAPSLDPGALTLAAAWTGSTTSPAVHIAIAGPSADAVRAHATGWQIELSGGCGSGTQVPPTTIPVSEHCLQLGGALRATITFSYYGAPHRAVVPVTGSAPPPPVDPAQLTVPNAQWGGTATSPAIQVQCASGQQCTAANLSWQVVVTSNGKSCGTSTSAPDAGGAISVAIDYAACPPGSAGGGGPNGYTVTVTITDTSHQYPPATKTPTLSGSPPQ